VRISRIVTAEIARVTPDPSFTRLVLHVLSGYRAALWASSAEPLGSLVTLLMKDAVVHDEGAAGGRSHFEPDR
jgi:hypothetical protein